MSPASIHKFDLSDPDALLFCSECASPYARSVESCVSCGATSFWSRAARDSPGGSQPDAGSTATSGLSGTEVTVTAGAAVLASSRSKGTCRVMG